MARTAIRYALLLTFTVLAGCTTARPPAAPAPTSLSPISTSAVPSQGATSLQCPDMVGALTGPVAFVGDGDLFTVGADGSNLQQVTNLPTTQWVQHPAWSPDGQTLAYTLNIQNPDPDLSWLPLSIICGVERATGKGRMLAEGEQYQSLTEPAWASDGKALYVTLARHKLDDQKQYISTDTEIARIDLATDDVTTIAANSSGAALSRDGKRMAYIFNNPDTFEIQLMLSVPDGQDAQQVKGPGSGWGQVLGASWSSDSTKLLFSASGATTSGDAGPQRALWERVLGIGVAQAHGAAMEIWSVNADGSGLTQLTAGKYDDPRAAWSPDQSHIAILLNSGGITLHNLADDSEQMLTDQGNFGGISWATN